MRKIIGAIILAVSGLWLLYQQGDLNDLEKILPKLTGGVQQQEEQTAAIGDFGPTSDTIRVASFNIQVFGETKAGKPEVMQILAEIVRKFDVVAIQEIRSKNENLIPSFVQLINSTGRQYDYLIGPRLGRSSSKEQYVYVFDTVTIETDRAAMYTVEDRYDLLHREPLVASFRTRGPAPHEAFTFTLINVHTDPDEVRQEMNVLDDVYRAVRDDGRGEDDIIMLGDFNADERLYGEMAAIPSMMWAIAGTTTNLSGTRLYDNLFFTRTATTEYTGNSGVYNFMTEFGLNMDQAKQVSDHFPVWAEFSVFEGGRPSRLAQVPETVISR